MKYKSCTTLITGILDFFINRLIMIFLDLLAALMVCHTEYKNTWLFYVLTEYVFSDNPYICFFSHSLVTLRLILYFCMERLNSEHVTSERVDVSHWSEGYLISLCREWICFVRFDFVLHTLNVTNCYLYIVSIISDLKSSLSSRVYFLIFSSYSK